MRDRHLIICTVLAAVLLAGAVQRSGKAAFTETAIDNGDSSWMNAEGDYECIIYGTWDSATADMETLISGTGDVKDVAAAALVGATADTGWQSIRLGAGQFRLEVSGGGGSEDLTFHCRRVSK